MIRDLIRRRGGRRLACGWTAWVLVAWLLAAPTMSSADQTSSASAADQTPSAESARIISAGKRTQPVSELAAPVTIITAEEIHAHGYHTLGEALQWVRGMYVTSDRVYSYLGIRGIQRPGDFNNKVLLAIDGHVMNGNVYGDAYMEASLGIPLRLVERIEVIHGPSSDLYGNDGVLAMVNVVMHRPEEGRHGMLVGRAGSAGRMGVSATVSSAKPDEPAILATASYLDSHGRDLYFPEFDSPSTNNGQAIDADGEKAKAFYGSMDWLGLRLVAKFNERAKHVPTASFGTLFGDNRYQAYDGHDIVDLSGTRRLSSSVDLFARGYWDHAHYHAIYVYDSGSGAVLNYDAGSGHLIGTEVGGHWSPSNRAHDVTLGLEGQFDNKAILANYDIDPYASYLDASREQTLLASYAQDRIQLLQALHLTAGVRADLWSHYDVQWSPSLGLTWIDPRQVEWRIHAARGFRMPTAYETLYETPEVLRNPDLGPERVGTLQGTVTRGFGPLDLLLTGYWTELKDVIDFAQIDSAGTLQYANVERVTSKGVEAEANLQMTGGNHLRMVVARQNSTLGSTGDPLTNSPAWDAGMMFRRDLTDEPLSLGFGVRYLSPRTTRTGRETATPLIADARVGRRFGSNVEIGFEVKNLFDARYGDPASGEFVQEQIQRDPRSFFVSLSLGSNLGR